MRESTQRREIFEYPLDAVRELVLNAVIHRKYNSPVDIQIKIFDKKITIFNPGDLYGNITVEDLQRDDYQASARNKLIVEAFFLTGNVEKYGTGYQRIRKAIEDYPTMKYACRETQGGFWVELAYEKQKETFDNIEIVTEKDTESVVKTVDENNTENNTENLTDRQKVIIKEIKRVPHITSEELSDIVGITADNIRVNLSKLKAKGFIERIGPSKGGYWKVIKSP